MKKQRKSGIKKSLITPTGYKSLPVQTKEVKVKAWWLRQGNIGGTPIGHLWANYANARFVCKGKNMEAKIKNWRVIPVILSYQKPIKRK